MSGPDTDHDEVPSVRRPAELPNGVGQATIGVRGGCCARSSKKPPSRYT